MILLINRKKTRDFIRIICRLFIFSKIIWYSVDTGKINYSKFIFIDLIDFIDGSKNLHLNVHQVKKWISLLHDY